jgi:hypothetical protein
MQVRCSLSQLCDLFFLMANVIIYKREKMIHQIEFKKGVQEVLSSKKKQ